MSERDWDKPALSPRLPIVIVRLKKTCPFAPAQWQGHTSDGAAVYIRYRNGVLRVHLGPGVGRAMRRAPIFVWNGGDPADGEMSFAQLRDRLPPSIVVSRAALARPRRTDGARP